MSRNSMGAAAYTPALVHKVGDNVLVRYPQAGRGSFNGMIFSAKPKSGNAGWSVRALLYGQQTPRETTVATNASQPAFSPDGKRIAFIRNGDLFIMNSDGTGQKRILESPGTDSHPSWWMPGT
jgi:Tol biopolymer transport system component